MHKYILYILLGFALLTGCGSKNQTKEQNQKNKETVKEKPVSKGYSEQARGIFKIVTYDNDRILETGHGFFIDSSLVVTKYDLFPEANKAIIYPFYDQNQYEIEGYTAVDRINNLIILKVRNVKKPPLSLYLDEPQANYKTLIVSKPSKNTLPLGAGKIIATEIVGGNLLYRISNYIPTLQEGKPVLLSNHQVLGLAITHKVDYDIYSYAIPSHHIRQLWKKGDKIRPLKELQSGSNSQVSEANKIIKGLRIETDYGDITIQLFNETPTYRDNFIRLVKEGYYDSLLIHRVIKDFVIQSGAADTRNAKPDDLVGWKGPGYTLPAHIVPKYFHKRGMIGSPRLPDRKNSKRRSDGSQYYIVKGRTYTDAELDEIEKEKKIRFTSEQHNAYKTIGGAPTLDGTYTLFGEVTSGMHIVDLISGVEVGNEFRPKKDIRVKRIRILE